MTLHLQKMPPSKQHHRPLASPWSIGKSIATPIIYRCTSPNKRAGEYRGPIRGQSYKRIRTSPTFSPPFPSLVQTARPFLGATSNPKGNLYRTSKISDGTERIEGIFILACKPELLGGISIEISKDSVVSASLVEDTIEWDRGVCFTTKA
jgi:hypothetical protein